MIEDLQNAVLENIKQDQVLSTNLKLVTFKPVLQREFPYLLVDNFKMEMSYQHQQILYNINFDTKLYYKDAITYSIQDDLKQNITYLRLHHILTNLEINDRKKININRLSSVVEQDHNIIKIQTLYKSTFRADINSLNFNGTIL